MRSLISAAGVALACTGCAGGWEFVHGQQKPQMSATVVSRDYIYTDLSDPSKDGKPFRSGEITFEANQETDTKQGVADDKKPSEKPTKSPPKTVAIVSWNPVNTAALVDNHGQACVQAAAAVRNTSLEGGVKVSITDKADVQGVNRVIDSATILSAKDAAASFLDVALFGICVIALNQTNNVVAASAFNKEDLKDMINEAVKQAADLGAKIAAIGKGNSAPDTGSGTANSGDVKVGKIGSGAPQLPSNSLVGDAKPTAGNQGAQRADGY